MKKLPIIFIALSLVFLAASPAWAPCGISGYVYCDVDQDGIFNNDDIPLEGVVIKLDGVPVATTDSTGMYSIQSHELCDGELLSIDESTLPEEYTDYKFVNPPNNDGVPYQVVRVDSGDPLPQQDFGVYDDACAPRDYEGCTPGYWKNSPLCWCDDYTPATTLGSVFEGKALVEEDSLMTALNYGGGPGVEDKARLMLRQCIAALLNACSADVNAEGTVEGIKTMVNTALDSDSKTEIEAVKKDCAGWNEDNPCPINSENAREPCSSKYDEQIEVERNSAIMGTAGGCGG